MCVLAFHIRGRKERSQERRCGLSTLTEVHATEQGSNHKDVGTHRETIEGVHIVVLQWWCWCMVDQLKLYS